jgi:hypothetical protein
MLDYVALFVLIFVVLVVFYGIIAIHDIPYEIAHRRNHPHQDAIHAAGWVSLFTLHVLYPFLWIWAMAYRPDRGWGLRDKESEDAAPLRTTVEELRDRVAALEAERRPAMFLHDEALPAAKPPIRSVISSVTPDSARARASSPGATRESG